jgi:uncharacterized protein YdaU (DUF1376 family)
MRKLTKRQQIPMTLWVGDYLAGTVCLSGAQHGAFLLLIMHYWLTGGLPDDDRQLACIARLSLKQWLRNKPVIQAFFSSGWRHNRLDEEFRRAAAIEDAAPSQAAP